MTRLPPPEPPLMSIPTPPVPKLAGSTSDGGARVLGWGPARPEAPAAGQIPSCDEAGVLGAVAGVLGTLQATEVLKEILGIGESMAGRLLIYDALSAAMRQVKVNPDPDCALCGPAPSITDLSPHRQS